MTWIKLLSLFPNSVWKLVKKGSMKWLSKERKDISQKDQKFKWTLAFDVPKFKFQDGLKQRTYIFWALLRHIGLWEPNPQYNVQVFCRGSFFVFDWNPGCVNKFTFSMSDTRMQGYYSGVVAGAAGLIMIGHWAATQGGGSRDVCPAKPSTAWKQHSTVPAQPGNNPAKPSTA